VFDPIDEGGPMRIRRPHSLAPAGLAALVALLGACASMRGTPQQDYVWEMGRVCDGEVFEFKMERVEADGRYWIKPIPNSTGGAKTQYFECMNAQFKAHPYLDWLKAQQKDALPLPVAAGTSSGVATAAPSPIDAPVWEVGDEWQYAYKTPSDSGTYVWAVIRLETLDGVPHYVIKSGTREIFYRVSDLASSIERVNGTLVVKHTPPVQSYAWPLAVGKTWEQTDHAERPLDRQTTDRNTVWTVEAEETVTVPAGTFRTVKIVWRNKNTGSVYYEMWYAAAAKQWVKIREAVTGGFRERELVSYKLK
jgi:hypothetical protein